MDLIKRILIGVAVVIAIIAIVIIGASLINSNMSKNEDKEVVVLNQPGGDKDKNIKTEDSGANQEQKDTEKEITTKENESTIESTEVANNKEQNTESSLDKKIDNNQNNDNVNSSGDDNSTGNNNNSNSSENNTNQNVSNDSDTTNDNSENIEPEDSENGESSDDSDVNDEDKSDSDTKDKDETNTKDNKDEDKEGTTETPKYVDEEEEKRKKELETENPLIYVDEVSAKTGTQNIKVNVNVKNNPGILGMILTVYFDESAMQLKQVANGSAVSNVLDLTEANVLKSGCNFVWDGQEIGESEIKDGSVLELEFETDKNIAQGKYPIKIVCEKDDVIDSNLTPVELSIVNGSIKIE